MVLYASDHPIFFVQDAADFPSRVDLWSLEEAMKAQVHPAFGIDAHVAGVIEDGLEDDDRLVGLPEGVRPRPTDNPRLLEQPDTLSL